VHPPWDCLGLPVGSLLVVGSWYISIEEYSLRWMFHRIGMRGSTGGWTGDGVSGCVVASLDGLLGGNGSRTGRGLARGFGVVAKGYEGGEK